MNVKETIEHKILIGKFGDLLLQRRERRFFKNKKAMRRYLSFLFLYIILMSGQCRDPGNCHQLINIVNNSDYDVVISHSTFYPDSISDFGRTNDSFNPPIPAHGTGKLRLIFDNGCMEFLMKDTGTFRYGIMMLFFFDRQVYETVSRDTIVKNRMYLRKYDLTLEDLEASNWTITYP